jgi:hypothetical protein
VDLAVEAVDHVVRLLPEKAALPQKTPRILAANSCQLWVMPTSHWRDGENA